MLTDLADVLRRAGLSVVERDGWKTRGHGGEGARCSCSGTCDTPGQLAAVSSIVLHHTAGPATGEAPSLGVVQNGRTGLAGPLAQLVLGRSGTWYVVAAGKAWHAGTTFEPWQDNAHSVGIEAEATGVDAWPAAQYASYVRGARALADRYGVPYARVLGHKEVAKPSGRKRDPNFSTAAFRAALTSEEDNGMEWTTTVTNMNGHQVQFGQVVNGIERRVTDAQAGVDAVGGQVGQLSTVVGDLAERIDGLAVGGVDLDALAAKVADLLSARLAA